MSRYIFRHYIQGGPKMALFLLNASTLSNINRCSKFFHCQNQEKICNNIITKDTTTPQVCRYTTLWNVSVLKAIIENKTRSMKRCDSNRLDSSPGCLGTTCQGWWTWRSHAAGTSVCSSISISLYSYIKRWQNATKKHGKTEITTTKLQII